MFDQTTELKTRCECCNRFLNEYEEVDPIVIDRVTMCDSCAGNLTQLRLQGYIKEVSDRTKLLKEAHNWSLYHAAADKITPYRTVKTL